MTINIFCANCQHVEERDRRKSLNADLLEACSLLLKEGLPLVESIATSYEAGHRNPYESQRLSYIKEKAAAIIAKAKSIGMTRMVKPEQLRTNTVFKLNRAQSVLLLNNQLTQEKAINAALLEVCRKFHSVVQLAGGGHIYVQDGGILVRIPADYFDQVVAAIAMAEGKNL
jgi:hypothetical protein